MARHLGAPLLSDDSQQPMHGMPTDDDLALHFDDPTLLRGASSHTLLKNRSEIFSSNVLSSKDVAELHRTTAVVPKLDDFYSHSWATERFDKWATLLLYMNAPAAAVALVATAVLWSALENIGIIPTLLLLVQNDQPTSCMPILVGYFSAILTLFQWQRMRQLVGLPPRMCFLDKICIDQVDEVRKSAGIASLGAFLGSSTNFVVLFSPEYFTRLWCCYEVACFYQVQNLNPGSSTIRFVPVGFARVIGAYSLTCAVYGLSHAFLPLYGPLVGIDPLDLSDAQYDAVCAFSNIFSILTMYECQRYAAASEQIEAQIADFSITRAECFEERDRVRIEREVAKWFGSGDRERGVRAFDAYVRQDIRRAMEKLAGTRDTLSANLPWVYLLFSGGAGILEDIASLCKLQELRTWDEIANTFMSDTSCALVGTPICPVIFLWLATKKFRFCGGWPMMLLAPFIAQLLEKIFIVGELSNDVTTNACQYVAVLLFGVWVFRESLLGMCGCGGKR